MVKAEPRPAAVVPFEAYFKEHFGSAGPIAKAPYLRVPTVHFPLQPKPVSARPFSTYYKDNFYTDLSAEQPALYQNFKQAKRIIFKPPQASLREFPLYYAENFKSVGPLPSLTAKFPPAKKITFAPSFVFPVSGETLKRMPSVATWRMSHPPASRKQEVVLRL